MSILPLKSQAHMHCVCPWNSLIIIRVHQDSGSKALASDTHPVVLEAPEGSVELAPLPNGKFLVTLKPHDSGLFIARSTCQTSLPPDVVRSFLDVSFAWLCEALARHEEPEYIKSVLSKQLFAYFDPSDFAGKRLLDFGCGSGASTFWMAELLPDTEMVGLELNPGSINRARQILSVSKHSNVKFFLSPDPNSLPPDIGKFDFIMLSAVYEHLLPEERRRVMPLLWSVLRDGGVLFINQTPHRYFPYEHHSTGLWFVNYLPDRLTHFLARKFSKKDPAINQSPDWNVHLRGGIRGGTETEILRNLRLEDSGKPTIIQPISQDRADYWLSCTNRDRHLMLKRLVAGLFRLTDKYLGTVPSINVDVVIRKDPS